MDLVHEVISGGKKKEEGDNTKCGAEIRKRKKKKEKEKEHAKKEEHQIPLNSLVMVKTLDACIHKAPAGQRRVRGQTNQQLVRCRAAVLVPTAQQRRELTRKVSVRW